MTGDDYCSKTVIVSGCPSGLGASVAEQFVALGADVHGPARNVDGGLYSASAVGEIDLEDLPRNAEARSSVKAT